MTPVKIGILDDFQNVTRGIADWSRLPAHASVTVFNEHFEGEELIRRILPFNVLVITRERTPFPRSMIERLPNLKLLVTAGWRNLGIDMAACRDHGILVCGTEAGSSPTAELAWGLILAVARRIAEEDKNLRAGRWQSSIGFTLKDKTLGILGLGRLGAQMARVGAAFGMDIVAWSQNLTPERAAQSGAARVEKSELFRQADVLTIHLLLSDRTRGIVGREEIALMKDTAILVNTARAAIVDEAALIAALTAGTIAGAGLDVYSREPVPPDAAILKAPNTVLTPHLGYVTRETYGIYFPQALEDIEAWLKGTPIRVIAD
ncbi:MAG TPA: D-2-hydroxyacid dehydrogenase family protein [Micropepsaceae bacterium]|nr:D-2-hydroxyacid dehydrogenase family protein [Micropepsaceae bacterium]